MKTLTQQRNESLGRLQIDSGQMTSYEIEELLRIVRHLETMMAYEAEVGEFESADEYLAAQPTRIEKINNRLTVNNWIVH
jgi:hypothetical protein